MGAIDDYKKAIEKSKDYPLNLLMLLFCCYVDTLTQTEGDEQIEYAERFKDEIIAHFENLQSNN